MSTQYRMPARRRAKLGDRPGVSVRLGLLLAAVTAVGAFVAVTLAPADTRTPVSTTGEPTGFWAHTWDQTDAQPAPGYGADGVVTPPRSYADLPTVGSVDEYPGGGAAAEAPRSVVRETHQEYEGTLEQSPSVVAWPAPTDYDS